MPYNTGCILKLISFSVENYRSITTARKIQLENYSLLVGANNEGKSNILHALALGMNALSAWVSQVRRMPDGRLIRVKPSLLGNQLGFDWTSDYPIDKQAKAKEDSCTRITLEFGLDDDELAEFSGLIKSNLNGTLPILLSFGRSNFDLSVQKPGRGHATLNRKSTKIASFVSDRIGFHYIPAIRTSSSAAEVIGRLVEKELRSIENDPEYVAAMEKIEQLQKPIFDELADAIKDTVAGFLPTVKSVELVSARESRYRSLRRNFEILIDDGSKTKLSRKGDGVQSLTALALMRHAAMESADHVKNIIAIEEPESHLHPRAIHELKAVVEAIAEKTQVILTSHSPLFVRPGKLQNTIIVQDSKAKSAGHVAEIRDALGVRFSDNLQNARLVLIFEGADDVLALRSILTKRSAIIGKSLDSGFIALDHLGGASSLSQKASFYKSSACDIQAFIDNDASGKLAVDRAVKARSLKIADVNLSAVPGKEEAELEDLYDKKIYRDAFLAEFGVDVTRRPVGKKVGKWSDLMAKLFFESGKPWTDSQKDVCKTWLANFARHSADDIIHPKTSGALDAFVASVEGKIGMM